MAFGRRQTQQEMVKTGRVRKRELIKSGGMNGNKNERERKRGGRERES
jgi:hypothetical protein